MAQTASICVIIAAKNAADTIEVAVKSALREPEVAEVVVVDDGSNDGTAQAAGRADDASGRLNVIRFEKNRGPSAARNHAIDISSAPLIAILDADDFFFEGRFRRMLADSDWEFVADNIAFVDADTVEQAPQKLDVFADSPLFLDLATFVDGNISKPGVRRGEIGFLKPIMRRSFLDGHGLRYREEMRLGEDYDLYIRALAHGARYKVIHSCGYGAVVRSNSLSGSHRTEDLRRLYEADRALLGSSTGLPPRAVDAVRRHERHVRGKYELRRFLDIKAQSGALAALAYIAANPFAFPAIATGIVMDKTERLRNPGGVAVTQSGRLRYLLDAPAK
ncbi:glycosyltransferase family 2 protein [Rhizobium sp. Root1220]|uniref:glycosyltransferase family 2 protein n=1 Tax=Rhizobium sp. Root1220 TaxID=1736432 RepID=UPI0006F8E6B3|nr:glycosyltransferase family 2 protein [Rhizobium sp. Root1220]KQV83810.1 glycosyl transferase family A [Rhizobium sp. Root1220]